MAKNYKAIAPKGQIDPTACWMACLSWWLKAAHNKSQSQIDIMGSFGAIWSSDGTIDATKLIDGVRRNNATFKMYTEEIYPGSLEYWVDGSFPFLIGFKRPGGFGHMNVIHSFNSATKTVEAMEPWYPENLTIIDEPGEIPYIEGNKKFTGKHVKRQLSYYGTALPGSNGLLIGIPQ